MQSFYNVALHLARQTGGKSNDALVIGLQNLHIHTGLIIIAFRKTAADNFHQVGIACIVFR